MTAMAAKTVHYVVLTLAAGTCRYATEADALALIERFGHGLGTTVAGDTVWVRCAEQRGQAGAFELHRLACVAGIPVGVTRDGPA